MSEPKINNPRVEIDRIDGEILRLLNERAAIALRVGAAKSSVDTSLCDPKRESEVLTRLAKENSGPFDEQSIENIFQRIIDESLHLQQKTYRKPLATADETRAAIADLAGKSRVAFQGEHGSFSEAAALGILGADCQTVPCQTFEDLYRAIDLGFADYILSPLENSLVGSSLLRLAPSQFFAHRRGNYSADFTFFSRFARCGFGHDYDGRIASGRARAV